MELDHCHGAEPSRGTMVQGGLILWPDQVTRAVRSVCGKRTSLRQPAGSCQANERRGIA